MVKRGAGNVREKQRVEAKSPASRSQAKTAPPRHISQLADRHSKWEAGHGRPLNPSEKAELHSWLQFPNDNDAYLRDLVFKKCLSEDGAGPPLSPEEAAALRAQRSGLRESDEMRQLVKKNTAPAARSKSSPPTARSGRAKSKPRPKR